MEQWTKDLASAVRPNTDPVQAVVDVIQGIAQEVGARLEKGGRAQDVASEIVSAASGLARAALAGTFVDQPQDDEPSPTERKVRKG